MWCMIDNVKDSIQNFSAISLEDMNSVALLKRTDTKFVISLKDLNTVLKEIKDNYKVLEIGGNRCMSYASLYFDTDKKDFYHDHHNGKVNRTKVRMRKYLESNLCFLEIKQKNGKGDTNKSRIVIPDFETELSEENISFIEKTTQKNYNLTPSLWNYFNRITLVSLLNKERVTIDLNLKYSINNQNKEYEDLVIVELKQKRFNRQSELVKALKSNRINPYSISKYCIGMTHLYSDLKRNLFKHKLLKLNKITA